MRARGDCQAEKAMGGQMEDAGRAADRLEPTLQRDVVEPRWDAQEVRDGLALGPRARQAAEVECSTCQVT